MYLKHYQLEAKPFQITSDPKFLWLGEKHREALATLRYGILDNRGFLLLTGEVGTGKTILINRLLKMLDVDTVVATLPDPDLQSMDFYNLLADGFGMDRLFDSKGDFLIHLRKFLHECYAKQRQVLLIIDESQRLEHHLMEDIRVLSNIELDDRKLINIFFVGQQEFNALLTAPKNRALAQRITVRYDIAPLDQDEIALYVNHRLKVAGGRKKLFDATAIEEIFKFSGGIPRLINVICDHALLTGYARGAALIDGQIIKECADELRIPVKIAIHPQNNIERAPDSKSIAVAAAKTENDENSNSNEPMPIPAQSMEPPEPVSANTSAPGPASVYLKGLYALVFALLIGVVGYFVGQFSGEEKARYDTESLPPDSATSRLEKENVSPSINMDRQTVVPEQRIPAIPVLPEEKNPPVVPEKPAQLSDETQADSGVVVTTSTDSEKTEQVKQMPSEELPPEKPPAVKPVQTGLLEIEPESTVETIAPLPLIKEKVMIQYEFDSNEIKKGSYSTLDRIAAYLVQHPDEKINVKGYTDSSGSKGYNESVSRFRASSVRIYLIGKGVSADNIEIFAMGDASPVAPNDTPEGRRLNRRVEIEFVAAASGTE